jgi:dephospho-CoA kinase
VGLTGGIATGKSTVSSTLKSTYDIPVIDADVLSRKVVEPKTRVYKQIVSYFGEDILQEDRTINRAKLGQIIFNDSTKRRKLNQLVHPAVSRAMAWDLLKYWLRGHRACILDVPLLIESGIWKWVGTVVVVYW